MRRNVTDFDSQDIEALKLSDLAEDRYAHDSSHAARQGRRRKKLGRQYPRPILPLSTARKSTASIPIR